MARKSFLKISVIE